MHNRTVLAVAAVVALAATGPAHAATTVTYDEGQVINITPSSDGQTWSGSFSADVTGDGGDPSFTSSFTFTVPSASVASIAAISISSNPESNIDFTSGFLDGTIPFTISNGGADVASLDMVNIAPGTYTFILNGNLNAPSGIGSGAFGGNVSFSVAPVPEPATWALFILGFAAIGGALRRSTATTRETRANLKFAQTCLVWILEDGRGNRASSCIPATQVSAD